MRFGDKGMTVLAGENHLLGVDFHDLIQQEHNGYMAEAAAEFGFDPRNAKKLKKQLERN